MKKVLGIIALTLVLVMCISLFNVLAMASQEKKTVTMWTFLDINRSDPREKALKEIIDDFHRKHPEIEVRVEPQAWATMPMKFFMAHTTGSAPDICWINTANLGALVQSGAGADLNGLFIDQWTKEEEQDFYIQAGWDATYVDGKRYSVPIFHNTQLIFYRKDLFAEAGIAPDSLKTWDQFIVAARKLTLDKNKDGVIDQWGFGFPLSIEKGDTNPFIYSLLELQGEAFDESGPLYATEAGVKSLMLQVDFVTRHNVTPSEAITYTADDIVDQFCAGRYAMIVGPSARFTSIQQNATWDPEQLAILQWPNWTDERHGPFTVKGWWAAIWSGSRNGNEAAKFLEYMISPEAQMIWAKIGGQVPTRLSVFTDPYFEMPQNRFMHDLVKGWSGWSWLNPIYFNMSGYEDDLNEATQKVILRNEDPMHALKEAEKKFMERQD